MASPRQLAETSEWDVVPTNLIEQLQGKEPTVVVDAPPAPEVGAGAAFVPADVDPRIASAVATRLLRVRPARLDSAARTDGEHALVCVNGTLSAVTSDPSAPFDEDETYRRFVALCGDVQNGASIRIERMSDVDSEAAGTGVSPLRLVARLVLDRGHAPDRLCPTCDVVGDPWWEVVFSQDDRAVPVRIPPECPADNESWADVLAILTAWRDTAQSVDGNVGLLSVDDTTRIVVRKGRHFGMCVLPREHVGIILKRLGAITPD